MYLMMILNLIVISAQASTENVSNPDTVFIRIDANDDSRKVVAKKCGSPNYTIVELGLIDGETKIVRFFCNED